MIRYIRLYVYFLRFSFSRALEFRFDFCFRVLMDILYYAVNLLFFRVIFQHSDLLAGWTQPQVDIFVCSFLVVDALFMTIFSNNIWWLPLAINKGEIDYYLVRPVSPYFFLCYREFAANSFLNLIMAVSLLAGSLYLYPHELGGGRILLFIIFVLNGAWLFHLLNLLATIPVFWLHSGRGLQQIFWSVDKFMERPDRIYQGPLRWILITLLPFSLVASYPSRLLFDENIGFIIIHLLLVSLVFSFLVMVIWKLALRSYSSASS